MDLVYMQQTRWGGTVIWCEQRNRTGHQHVHDKIRIRTNLSPVAFLLHFLERCVFEETLTLHETTANEQQSFPNWQVNGSGDESTDMFT